jgi:hypothetical protein
VPLYKFAAFFNQKYLKEHGESYLFAKHKDDIASFENRSRHYALGALSKQAKESIYTLF